MKRRMFTTLSAFAWVMRGRHHAFPELDAIPARRRRQVLWRCQNKALKHWEVWVGSILCGLCSGAGIWLGWRLYILLGIIVHRNIGALLGAVIGALIGSRVAGRWIDPVVRKYLRAELGTHCVRCGYDLRATPGRCPECGLVPAAPPPQGNVQ